LVVWAVLVGPRTPRTYILARWQSFKIVGTKV